MNINVLVPTEKFRPISFDGVPTHEDRQEYLQFEIEQLVDMMMTIDDGSTLDRIVTPDEPDLANPHETYTLTLPDEQRDELESLATRSGFADIHTYIQYLIDIDLQAAQFDD